MKKHLCFAIVISGLWVFPRAGHAGAGADGGQAPPAACHPSAIEFRSEGRAGKPADPEASARETQDADLPRAEFRPGREAHGSGARKVSKEHSVVPKPGGAPARGQTPHAPPASPARAPRESGLNGKEGGSPIRRRPAEEPRPTDTGKKAAHPLSQSHQAPPPVTEAPDRARQRAAALTSLGGTAPVVRSRGVSSSGLSLEPRKH